MACYHSSASNCFTNNKVNRGLCQGLFKKIIPTFKTRRFCSRHPVSNYQKGTDAGSTVCAEKNAAHTNKKINPQIVEINTCGFRCVGEAKKLIVVRHSRSCD